jgi:hypothetical protein
VKLSSCLMEQFRVCKFSACENGMYDGITGGGGLTSQVFKGRSVPAAACNTLLL